MLIVDYGREGIQWASDSLAEIGTFTIEIEKLCSGMENLSTALQLLRCYM
jgi:hypothetical protein